MKKHIPRWQIWGFLFTGALGTFLHFLFDLTGENAVVALFSAVNESIWEHMKLIYYPMLLFALWEYFVWGKKRPDFWRIKLRGILLGLILIPVIYYTYTGISGQNIDWLNIAIFFLAAGVSFYYETKRFEKNTKPCKLAFPLILLLGGIFMVLTFLPPHIPFFHDPVTGTYGYPS